RRHDSVGLRPENEFLHHDAWWHGRGGRTHHRRRHCHGRTHCATCTRFGGRRCAFACPTRRQRIYQSVGRFLRRDHHHLYSTRISQWRHRRVFLSVITHNGGKPHHLIFCSMAGRADSLREPAANGQ